MGKLDTVFAGYPAFFRRVKAVLLDGQQRIEAERLRTFWEAGWLIQTYILQNKERAKYGGAVVLKLAEDLGVDPSLVKRCRRFFQRYPQGPIGPTSAQLTWSHYQELIDVSDNTERSRLEKAVLKNGLTIQELRARKRDLRQSEAGEARSVGTAPLATVPSRALLVPLKGTLYTYQIIRPKLISAGNGSALGVDLGFKITRNVGPRLLSSFSDGDVVASIPKEDAYRFSKADRTAQDLYTYQAFVTKVVDGDTLHVHVDLGFDTWIDETLRLRGIDCPEMKTREGDAAKAYVQSLIKEADLITVRSYKPDKFDRYLADIFIPGEDGGVYLNNLLLEKGHAVRYE
jgi:micrococcal nuclease